MCLILCFLIPMLKNEHLKDHIQMGVADGPHIQVSALGQFFQCCFINISSVERYIFSSCQSSKYSRKTAFTLHLYRITESKTGLH